MAGWWFGCHFLFSHPNWELKIIPIDELIFFRGVAQPPTSIEHGDVAQLSDFSGVWLFPLFNQQRRDQHEGN